MKFNGRQIVVILALCAGAAWAGEAIDVTEKVAAAATRNSLTIKADNSIFSDPAHGKIKRLRVEYSAGETVLTNTVNEKMTLTIEAPPGKRLIILKATYGVF